MAKEPDQTKWVGIRPTDPSEDIPTTTRQLAPAIADLQAIYLPYQQEIVGANKNCTVLSTITTTGVPAGELLIVTHISASNLVSMCDIMLRAAVTGASKPLRTFYSTPAGLYVDHKTFIVLPQGGTIKGYFYLGGGADNIILDIFGYKVGVY